MKIFLSSTEEKDLTVQFLTGWFPMVTELDAIDSPHFQYSPRKKGLNKSSRVPEILPVRARGITNVVHSRGKRS